MIGPVRKRRAALATLAALLAGALLLSSGARAGERPATIPAEVYAKRRAALAARAPDTAHIFSSGKAPQGEHDTDFRVESDFYYLTGIDLAGAFVQIEGGRTTLHLPPRNASAERWEGPRLNPENADAKALGVDAVAPIARGQRLTPTDASRDAVAALRLVKDEHELSRLRRAIDITCIALGEVARSLEPGQREFEMDALLRYVFRREGAERAGFPSIFGSGPNSCILHYSRNDRTMKAGDLVVCDVGAEFGRYSADVTRTFPVSGKFTAEQRRVYDIVLRAQDAGIAAVKPGARVRDVHAAALRVLQKEGLAKYFFHGTSHWLGLDVHDVGDYDAPLTAGMVLTVEPGAYITEKEIGVRIEDDVLVTESGSELLSAGVPRSADEIEALMREKGLGNQPIGPMPAAPRRRVGEF